MSSFASSSFKRSLIWACKFCLHTCAIYNLEFVESECASCSKEKNYSLENESLLVGFGFRVVNCDQKSLMQLLESDVCKCQKEELLWLESMMFASEGANQVEEKSYCGWKAWCLQTKMQVTMKRRVVCYMLLLPNLCALPICVMSVGEGASCLQKKQATQEVQNTEQAWDRG